MARRFIYCFSFIHQKMVHLSQREQQLPGSAIESILDASAKDKRVISLGPGEPHFGLPPPLLAHARVLIATSNHYTAPSGLLELREAICKKLARDNKIHALPENVVVTTGSQEALLIATAISLDVSEEILLPNPSYMAFLPTIELFNAKPRFFALHEEHDFEPNPDEIKKQINQKTRVILLNSPANPTGNVIRRKIMEEIADIAVEKDLAVFSDEAYERITYERKHISMASLNGMQDRTFTFQSFSKTFAMCGFRLGYVAAPEEAAAAIRKTHLYTTICAPTLSQKLGIKALQLPHKYTDSMVREYARGRKLVHSRLNNMGLTTPLPHGAFYAFSNVKHLNKSSTQFALDLFRKEKVAVIPGSDFGTNGEGHIRVSFATELSLIKEALDRMERFTNR